MPDVTRENRCWQVAGPPPGADSRPRGRDRHGLRGQQPEVTA